MTFQMRIDSNNDAFTEDGPAETARILREVADRLENGDEHAPVRDINGNTVGEFIYAA